MKKELPKAVKALKPGDRIVLIGTDNNPFETDVKGLTSVFQKILMVPLLDYGSRLALWGRTLQTHGAHLTDAFDLSSLAKISERYTARDIVLAVQAVLGPMRKKQQAIKVSKQRQSLGLGCSERKRDRERRRRRERYREREIENRCQG